MKKLYRYIIFNILICSHLFKSEDLFVDIESLYKDLNAVLDKYGSSLSPVENFEIMLLNLLLA